MNREIRQALGRLESLVVKMDLPPRRKKIISMDGLRWLARNMAIRNRDHPQFKEAYELVQSLLQQKENRN